MLMQWLGLCRLYMETEEEKHLKAEEERLKAAYLRETNRQRSLHTYQHLRALYLKEVLSQATLHMASRVLHVSTIRDRYVFCHSFVYELVKDLLMNELEIAVMTFFMWRSREDAIPSLELLMVICGFHAKALMTSEMNPIQAYMETAYPYFTAPEYAQWRHLRANEKLEPKKLNSIYRQLSSCGTYNNYIDSAIAEFAAPPAFALPSPVAHSSTQGRDGDLRKPIDPQPVPARIDMPVVESFLEPPSLRSMPSLGPEQGSFPFEIDDDLLRQRSFDGGQSSYPS